MSTFAVCPWEGEDLALLELPENYFELFDLPVSFALDARRLAERYRDLQVATDRDRLGASFDASPAFPQRPCDQVSAAYRTLKDPQERARYLLALHTGEPVVEGASLTDWSSVLEQMELRESLQEAQSGPNTSAALASILTQLAERRLVLAKELESLFADPSSENLDAAREVLGKLELLDRCQRDAEAVASSLDSRP